MPPTACQLEKVAVSRPRRQVGVHATAVGATALFPRGNMEWTPNCRRPAPVLEFEGGGELRATRRSGRLSGVLTELLEMGNEAVHILVALEAGEAASRFEAPTRAHRRIIVPSSHRFTRRVVVRSRPFRFSIGLVVENVRVSDAPSPKVTTVSVSSSPSRTEAAALGLPPWAFAFLADRSLYASRRMTAQIFAGQR
jgi:hypothetical protein